MKLGSQVGQFSSGIRRIYSLEHNDYAEITMYETLLRPHEVDQIPQPQPIGEISEKLKEAEKRREEKRIRQIANNKARMAAIGTETTSSPASISIKRKWSDDGDMEPIGGTPHDLAQHDASPDVKRIKTEEGGVGVEVEADSITAPVRMDMINAEGIEGGLVAGESRMEITPSSSPRPGPRISVSNALPEVRGHTSYLTFAVLVPFTASVVPSGTGTEDASARTPTPDVPSATTPPEAENKSSIVAP